MAAGRQAAAAEGGGGGRRRSDHLFTAIYLAGRRRRQNAPPWQARRQVAGSRAGRQAGTAIICPIQAARRQKVKAPTHHARAPNKRSHGSRRSIMTPAAVSVVSSLAVSGGALSSAGGEGDGRWQAGGYKARVGGAATKRQVEGRLLLHWRGAKAAAAAVHTGVKVATRH